MTQQPDGGGGPEQGTGWDPSPGAEEQYSAVWLLLKNTYIRKEP